VLRKAVVLPSEDMADTALHHLSAGETLERYRARELSPVEVLDAAIARVEACEPVFNAVCDRRYDEARAEAEASAARYAGGGEPPRALEGLLVAAKEEQPMAGRICSYGSLAYTNQVAAVTHPLLERLQQAGAVIHIRTTTPEFSCAGFTHGALWGVTRNPWNPDYSPGGSSGGSGAALAAGYAPLATGSDIGGSIRVPASFSGVVGFKPPYGRIPSLPPFNLDHYCHDGPMARTVADCARLAMAGAGRHPVDVVSLPDPPPLPLTAGPVADLRLALCLNLGDFPLDPEVEANTRAAAEVLASAGATMTEVRLPWTMGQVRAAYEAHFAAIFGPAVLADHLAHPGLVTPYARHFALACEALLAAQGPGSLLRGLEVEGRLYEPLGRLLTELDALICPTVGTRGLVAGEDYVDTGITVGGTLLADHFLALLTVPFNIASRCPVLSVPSGLARNGVPTGLQIVGRTYDDATPFRLALAYEAAVGGFPLPPDVSVPEPGAGSVGRP
jgi:Asp-tRNA(Asn)/Glu-tRNA(Gln) amidotransferase A subunit family amidase